MTTLTNSLKARLKEPDALFGLWLSMGSSAAAEALTYSGFDWLCIDMEHSPNDSRDVEHQLRAIEASHQPSEAVVRVPSHDAWQIKRALDAGARTLIFPGIDTAEQAAMVVRHTRYPDVSHPDGLRGVAGSVRAAAYGSRRDYVQGANAQLAVIAQIESAQALANIDAIAATPGIDCLFIGPNDLMASIGHLGDSKHPDVEAAFMKVVEAAEAAGIASGIMATDASGARYFHEMGFRFISLGIDVVWLMRSTRQALKEARS